MDDAIGQELAPGDMVLIATSGYVKLYPAVVIALTPQRVRVLTVHAYNFAGSYNTLVAPHAVVKLNPDTVWENHTHMEVWDRLVREATPLL